MDGARLGYGLAAEGNDVTAAGLARLSDTFYIGGTKVGALFGEALVIVNEALKKDFRYMIKQRGGMLAKGRLLGVQFECLFEDDTYARISRHAVGLAMRIRDAFEQKGCAMLYDSKTNQQFPILTNEQMEALSGAYAFSFWRRIDDTHAAVRFCTSWATEEAQVDALLRDIARL